MTELVTMSQKEISRFSFLSQVLDKKMSQVRAAELLELSDRQIRNLLKTLRKEGYRGIISKKRGKVSNRCKAPDFKGHVLALIRERYSDFGPSFAVEKLKENHKIDLSSETLRKWMIQSHMWIPKIKRRNIHPPRARREHFGELIQVDGSHHYWFEDRNAPCTLLVFIDDATSKITSMRFAEQETLDGYFEALRSHLEKWGIPWNIYSDRFSVFEPTRKKENLTQFQRALKCLGIKWIGANSPQAKGRVERVNRTLQDRLVKEMRLRKINTIEEANLFLEEYLAIHNTKFSKEPIRESNSHRPLEQGIDLDRTLARYEERTLLKDLTFQFHNRYYKILEPLEINGWNKKIEIRIGTKMRVFWKNKEIKWVNVNEIDEPILCSNKLAWKSRGCTHQENNHPWKATSFRLHMRAKEMKSYTGV